MENALKYSPMPADNAYMDNIANIEAQIADARRIQYVASQTRDAGAVFRVEDILTRLYADLDAARRA